MSVNDDVRYPWEDDYTIYIDEGDVFEDAHEDPYEITNLMDTFYKTNDHPAMNWQLGAPKHENCFSKLPWEVCEAIATHLPTVDALNMRLVTAAFYPLLASQTFWRSKFQIDGEYSFVFEKWDIRAGTDWLSLYKYFQQNKSPGWRNRRRIWTLAKSFVSLCELALADRERVNECYRKELHDELGFHFHKRYKVTGDLFDGKETEEETRFSTGCELFYTYTTPFFPDLAEIGFYVLSYFQTTYIVGVYYKCRRGFYIDIGYMPLHSNPRVKEYAIKFKNLKGFVLAMGGSGLHAIQVMSEKGVTAWIGNPENVPVTRRLADLDTILATRIGFDVS